jgi:hypothetical protein
MFDRCIIGRVIMALAILLITLCVSPAPALAQAGPPELGDDEVVETEIGLLEKKRGRLFETLTFIVSSPSAPHPDVRVIATDLPPGATFTDLGDGYGEFSWTPVTGQSGAYDVTFTDNTPGPAAMPPTETIPVIIAAYPLSHGFYRIPYDDGISFRVSRDHVTHTPPIKEDWITVGFGPLANMEIVAAADGRVRIIRDHFTVCCSDAANDINCSGCNNFVWIEHSNGEWTKYSHFTTGSVTGAAGLDTNDCVVQGQFLGYEGDVGHTSGSGSPKPPADRLLQTARRLNQTMRHPFALGSAHDVHVVRFARAHPLRCDWWDCLCGRHPRRGRL